MSTRLFALTTLAAALAACSSVPDNNAALEQARSRYSSAQADPQVLQLAPDELRRAGDALRTADQARSSGEASGRVDHLAYLASQRVTLAQDTASSRAAQAITAGAAAERDRLRLAQRTQEADSAAAALAVAAQTDAAKTGALMAAAAGASRDQARIERRDVQLNSLEVQLRELNAKKTARGMVVTLGDLLFSTGQAQLQPAGVNNIGKLAEFMKRNPTRNAAIEGYTDSVGSAEMNQALSDRRAEAVRAALVSQGVTAERLSIHGFGEDKPLAPNTTAAGRQANRRVEILFAPEAGDLMAK